MRGLHVGRDTGLIIEPNRVYSVNRVNFGPCSVDFKMNMSDKEKNLSSPLKMHSAYRIHP